MKIDTLKRVLIIGILFIGLISCGNTKETRAITKKVNDKELKSQLLKQKEIGYTYFYSKIKTDYESTKLNQSFKTSLKLTVDSTFSGTISYAGFIMANYLVTPDSLKLANKQEKCYFTEEISYISSLMGVELEFDFFQDMFLGKPVGVNKKVKYKQIKDKNKEYYILSTDKKRKYKKIEKEKINLNRQKNDHIFIRYYFSPDSLEIVKTMIEIPVDTISITVNYVEKIIKDGVKLPEYSTITITKPSDTIRIGLNYNKQGINKRKRHVFSIPKGYENCNL